MHRVGAGAPSAAPKIVTPPQLNLPSILPASVAEQIRRAHIKAALLGQGDPSWAIGAKCQAVYPGDGQSYPAVVTAISTAGNFIVTFDEYGGNEEVRACA